MDEVRILHFPLTTLCFTNRHTLGLKSRNGKKVYDLINDRHKAIREAYDLILADPDALLCAKLPKEYGYPRPFSKKTALYIETHPAVKAELQKHAKKLESWPDFVDADVVKDWCDQVRRRARVSVRLRFLILKFQCLIFSVLLSIGKEEGITQVIKRV